MWSRLIKKLKDKKGFTVIELMASATLMAIVVGLTTLTYFNSTQTAQSAINISKAATEARTAMYVLTKDTREIISFVDADEDEITFYSNVDQDEDVEEVHYYTVENGGYYTLYREFDAVSQTLGTKIISNHIFEYLTGYGEDILDTPVDAAELPNIRGINIRLLIDLEDTEETVRTMDLETSISLRNRL